MPSPSLDEFKGILRNRYLRCFNCDSLLTYRIIYEYVKGFSAQNKVTFFAGIRLGKT